MHRSKDNRDDACTAKEEQNYFAEPVHGIDTQSQDVYEFITTSGVVGFERTHIQPVNFGGKAGPSCRSPLHDIY